MQIKQKNMIFKSREVLTTEEVFSECLQSKASPATVNELLLDVEWRKVTRASLILGIPDFIYHARHIFKKRNKVFFPKSAESSDILTCF